MSFPINYAKVYLTDNVYILAILRPTSPASSTSSPSRHSSYSRPKTQITDHSTNSPSSHNTGNSITTTTSSSSCSSPVHHRANSGPTVITNLFGEPDPMTQSAIIPQPIIPHLSASSQASNNNGASTGSQLWKTRLTNIKNSFLGSPRFHRRKMQSEFL